MSRAARAVLDLLLPPACVRCGAALPSGQGMVCRSCWLAVPRLPAQTCDRCGHPRADPQADCRWCPALPSWVAGARSWCWVPEGAGGDLVRAFKYQGWSRLAVALGGRIAALGHGLPTSERAPLRVVGVPLGAVRCRERGYDQAALLAGAVGARWGVPVLHDALRRARETGSQVPLTPDARAANVQGAFAAGPGAGALRGAHVVLVDDVLTTAATLNACAAVVRDHGPSTIRYVTFGRARAAWDRATLPWSTQ